MQKYAATSSSPSARSIHAIALALVGLGCHGDDSKPLPTRRVTAHALVWNGRDPPADGRIANTPSNPRVYVFDAPVDCSAIPRGAFDDAPANSVRLEVVAYLKTWASGARAHLVFVDSFDGEGRRGGMHPSFPKSDDAVTLLSAPTERGSRARLRLDMEITFSRDTPARSSSDEADHALDLSGEIDAEVCGDIQ